MKNVIITGASGMIGSHLIDILISNNVCVTAVVRPDSPKANNICQHKLVDIVYCDINQLKDFSFVKAYDTFYHFAWEGVFGNDRNNIALQENNICNSLNAIRLAKRLGCNKFVFAGSQAEYGLQQAALTVSTVENPITPYGIAKCAVTKLGRILSNQLDMAFCSGRILSAYGPKDNNYTMVMSTLTKLLNGEECNLTSGEQIWDYAYAYDVANAMYLIAENGKNGKAYPIGGNDARKLKDYVLAMNLTVDNHEATLNFGAVPLSPTAVTHLEADISELTLDTGFLPKYSFEEGIKKTLDFIKQSK